MAYQIVNQWPVYCQITDGLIGSTSKALPMTYLTKALALKLAATMGAKRWDECGDDTFYVIDAATGKRVTSDFNEAAWKANDYNPF